MFVVFVLKQFLSSQSSKAWGWFCLDTLVHGVFDSGTVPISLLFRLSAFCFDNRLHIQIYVSSISSSAREFVVVFLHL